MHQPALSQTSHVSPAGRAPPLLAPFREAFTPHAYIHTVGPGARQHSRRRERACRGPEETSARQTERENV